MKGKISILIAAGIIIVAFVIKNVFESGATEEENHHTVNHKKYVKAAQVKYEDLQTRITAYGRLNAKNQIIVISEVSGIVLSGNPEFKEGNFIRKGQALVKLDNRDARLSLYALRSTFINTLVNIIPDIKSDFPDVYNLWKTYLDSFEIEKTTAEFPVMKNEKIKYFLAARQIYSSYYNIKNAELKLSKYSIIAPFDGFITSSNIETGNLVMPSQQLGSFKGVQQYELEVAITQEDVKYISTADKVTIRSSDNDQTWQGKVSRINPVIDPGSQTVNVFISVSGSDLIDGMYLKAEIHGFLMQSVFEIPRNAIFDQSYIYIIQDSSLVKTKINLLRKDEHSAYINGVDSLHMVVTEPLINVSSDKKVIPVSTTK